MILVKTICFTFYQFPFNRFPSERFESVGAKVVFKVPEILTFALDATAKKSRREIKN
jgi:hypothetical protein